MYRQVTGYLDENKDILKELPGFEENYSVLLNKTEEISNLQSEQMKYNKRKAWEKKELRHLLEEKLLEISGRITAFASLTKDSMLLCNCRITPWRISRLSHLDLHIKGNIVHKMADEHIGELAPYGITADALKSLKETTDAFFERWRNPESMK